MYPRAILLTLLVCGQLFADDIYAKQGNTPMVKDVMVVEEAGGKVYYIDKRLKRRAMSMSMVGRIAKKRCDVHEFKEREAAAKDADAVMELAAWAGGKRFHKDVIRALHERALELDPSHEAANLALGRVRYKGEWMTPAELEKRKQGEADDAQREKGLVKWKGEWVTPEDKARLERGLVKHNGRWMTPDQVKEEQGYVKHEGKWVKKDDLEVLKLVGPARKDTGLGDKLVLVQTENCAVMGDLPQAKLKELADSMEKLFSEWYRLFPEARGTDLLAGKYRLFAFKKARPYQKLARAIHKRRMEENQWPPARADLEKRRLKEQLRQTSFWDYFPAPFSAHVQMPDPFEGLKAHCIHFAANVLAVRHMNHRFPTWWLNEGIAYHFEKKITGTIQTFSADVGSGGYADVGPETNKQNPWLDATKWKDMLTNMVRTGRDPQLESLKSKVLWGTSKRMTPQDLAKAYSVTVFLTLDGRKKFAQFFKDVKTMSGGDAVEIETAAMIKHYGSYREVEKRWKQYALNGFRIAR